ncbi:hypothetical protein LOAG_05635 [Loa loa]|uniref:Uncharacterized protein n=1 Tax=Loa loa TaxID=7209 RepID=A0A1S0TZD0_LOALO|nr:hypothetical protein LOAG_05635 [Loa loa]EFO22845.1 hypothetical protein LOAG_05635 [Loa loa]
MALCTCTRTLSPCMVPSIHCSRATHIGTNQPCRYKPTAPPLLPPPLKSAATHANRANDAALLPE